MAVKVAERPILGAEGPEPIAARSEDWLPSVARPAGGGPLERRVGVTLRLVAAARMEGCVTSGYADAYRVPQCTCQSIACRPYLLLSR